MRTIGWEAAFWRELRDVAPKRQGRCQDRCDFGEGGGPCSQAHLLQKLAAVS